MTGNPLQPIPEIVTTLGNLQDYLVHAARFTAVAHIGQAVQAVQALTTTIFSPLQCLDD